MMIIGTTTMVRAHGEIDGHHEIDFTASANVVSESVQRNCPVSGTRSYTHKIIEEQKVN